MKLNTNNNSGAGGSKGRFFGLVVRGKLVSKEEWRRSLCKDPGATGSKQRDPFGLGWRKSHHRLATGSGMPSRLVMRMNEVSIMEQARPVVPPEKQKVTCQNLASILVVDENPNFLNTICQAIRRAGHLVVEAADGRMALEMAKWSYFDLMIADLNQPEQHGVETIMAFMQLHPETKIIAMTGNGTWSSGRNFLAIAQSLGVVKALEKPFSTDELLASVSHVLGLGG
jgi:CheY-like chemotaxis protein